MNEFDKLLAEYTKAVVKAALYASQESAPEAITAAAIADDLRAKLRVKLAAAEARIAELEAAPAWQPVGADDPDDIE